jgi:transcriptional regulator with XRE-family HTH domain
MTNSQPSMVNFDLIGARLREERLRLGGTQEIFAKRGGASLKTQNRYETGKQLPKLEYLLALAEHGLDWAYVLTGRRDDGSIGFTEQVIRDLIGKLDDREREAVMQMLLVLTGSTVDAGELTGQAASRPSLHTGYRRYMYKPQE